MKKMYIVLEDGSVFEGKSYGARGEATGEIVFTTGVVGYPEALTDASYYGQIVMHTFPLIGNYGIIDEDLKGLKPYVKAYIAREFCNEPSNFRCDGKIEDYLKENGIVAVCDVDTRELTKHIRENGVMNACITDDPKNVDFEALKAYKVENAVQAVSAEKCEYKAENAKYNVAVLNMGAIYNITDELLARNCNVTLLPYNTAAEELCSFDGVVISGGPADPKENTSAIETLKAVMGKTPVFGVGLGHQLMALAQGGDTEKMKFGHRGGSVPVRNMLDGKVFATSQNHGFVVKENSVPNAKVIFKNVSDGTCEGLEYENAFSIQFAPDVFSATVDTAAIYNKFVAMLGGDK